jgi:hypothetical protein
LAFSDAVTASLKGELEELERLQQGLAKRRALVEQSLSSHEERQQAHERNHDWRLSRCKLCRKAAARRLAKLALTGQVYGVGFACMGVLRRSSASLWRGLAERVATLDDTCCKMLRWALCSFASLATELSASLAAVVEHRKKEFEDTVELQKVILKERQDQGGGGGGGDGSSSSSNGGNGNGSDASPSAATTSWLDDRREEARRKKELIRLQLSELGEQHARLLVSECERGAKGLVGLPSVVVEVENSFGSSVLFPIFLAVAPTALNSMQHL